MNRKFAASALSALLFAQGLIGVAALATTLLHRSARTPIVVAAETPTAAPLIR